MATWYVPDDGDLQTVINNASPGDEIYIRSGNYYDYDPVTLTKRLFIRGQGTVSMHFKPVNASCFLLQNVSNAVLENIIIFPRYTGGATYGTIAAIRAESVFNWSFNNLGIYGSDVDYATINGINGVGVDGSIFSNILITHLRGYGIHLWGVNSGASLQSVNIWDIKPADYGNHGIDVSLANGSIQGLTVNTLYAEPGKLGGHGAYLYGHTAKTYITDVSMSNIQNGGGLAFAGDGVINNKIGKCFFAFISRSPISFWAGAAKNTVWGPLQDGGGNGPFFVVFDHDDGQPENRYNIIFQNCSIGGRDKELVDMNKKIIQAEWTFAGQAAGSFWTNGYNAFGQLSSIDAVVAAAHCPGAAWGYQAHFSLGSAVDNISNIQLIGYTAISIDAGTVRGFIIGNPA